MFQNNFEKEREDLIMYKKFHIAVIVALAFGLGNSVNNIAISDTTPKVAVVDATKIVANSSAVKTLKADQEKKVKAMQATIDKARAEISNEKDPQKIAQLEEKYRKEINQQKIALDNDYNKRLNQIDTDIRNAVVEKAKGMNYDLVLPKTIVFYGGEDITDIIAKDIK